jgi:hypothetical protein
VTESQIAPEGRSDEELKSSDEELKSTLRRVSSANGERRSYRKICAGRRRQERAAESPGPLLTESSSLFAMMARPA